MQHIGKKVTLIIYREKPGYAVTSIFLLISTTVSYSLMQPQNVNADGLFQEQLSFFLRTNCRSNHKNDAPSSYN